MHLDLILSMAADVHGDRVAVGTAADGLTVAELAAGARRVGAELTRRGVEQVALIDLNSAAVPLTLFGAAVPASAHVSWIWLTTPLSAYVGIRTHGLSMGKFAVA